MMKGILFECCWGLTRNLIVGEVSRWKCITSKCFAYETQITRKSIEVTSLKIFLLIPLGKMICQSPFEYPLCVNTNACGQQLRTQRALIVSVVSQITKFEDKQ